MERLFEIDLKDYKETDKVFRRPSARAIILIKDKIALVYSKKEKYFKFPGGGIHADEDKREALIREVREEVGMVVIPGSIREFADRRAMLMMTPCLSRRISTTCVMLRMK